MSMFSAGIGLVGVRPICESTFNEVQNSECYRIAPDVNINGHFERPRIVCGATLNGLIVGAPNNAGGVNWGGLGNMMRPLGR